MPEIVECPSCHRQLKVPETLLNQRVKCPSCQTSFEALPSSASTSAAPAPPAPPPLPPPAPERVSAAPVPRVSGGVPPSGQRPGKVQAIGIMTLVGGILAVINFLIVITSFGLGSMGICCIWPGFYYGLVVGVMAIVKGAALIGANAANETPPKAVAIMQIINIINFDVANLVMGILTLVFLGDPEVAACYRDPNASNAG
jgi:hypothetical protein